MRNIKLTIAYDGSDFHGWQIQPAAPTVQGLLTDAIQQITQERPTLYGAGRTDAGVHAWGQVANFNTTSNPATQQLMRGLNALLPPSVRIRAAEEAVPEFHARWLARAKTYHYRIARGRVVSPFHWRYALHDARPLDFDAMAEAACAFEGQHDFTSFAASSGSDEDDAARATVRTIYRSELLRSPATYDLGWPDWHDDADSSPSPRAELTSAASLQGSARAPSTEAPRTIKAPAGAALAAALQEEWVYVIRGKSFLRYMVRKIVGTILEVGLGRLTPGDIPRIFALRDRTHSGPTMPPHGLCLMSVEYPPPPASPCVAGDPPG